MRHEIMRRFGKVMALGVLCGLALGGTPALAAPVKPAEAGARVNLNTATAGELARLPGIGPSKAQAIVDHRAKEPFAKVDDLAKVKGIGDKLLESLRDQVTVGDAASPAGRGS